MSDAIYHESLLALYRSPLNKGTPSQFDKTFRAENRSCGDRLIFYVTLKKGKIDSVLWDGDGCALSIASASLFTEKIKGKTLSEIKKIGHEQLLKLLHIDKVTSGREKCVDLPIESFRQN